MGTVGRDAIGTLSGVSRADAGASDGARDAPLWGLTAAPRGATETTSTTPGKPFAWSAPLNEKRELSPRPTPANPGVCALPPRKRATPCGAGLRYARPVRDCLRVSLSRQATVRA